MVSDVWTPVVVSQKQPGTEDKVVQRHGLRPERKREEGRQQEREGGRRDRGSDHTVMTEGTVPQSATNLLAGQLVNTMYEVTVSSVDAIGLLRVITAPRVTHTRGRGGGGHCKEDRRTERHRQTERQTKSLSPLQVERSYNHHATEISNIFSEFPRC